MFLISQDSTEDFFQRARKPRRAHKRISGHSYPNLNASSLLAPFLVTLFVIGWWLGDLSDKHRRIGWLAQQRGLRRRSVGRQQNALDALSQAVKYLPRIRPGINHLKIKLFGQLIELLQQRRLIAPEAIKHVLGRIEVHARLPVVESPRKHRSRNQL